MAAKLIGINPFLLIIKCRLTAPKKASKEFKVIESGLTQNALWERGAFFNSAKIVGICHIAVEKQNIAKKIKNLNEYFLRTKINQSNAKDSVNGNVVEIEEDNENKLPKIIIYKYFVFSSIL